MRPLIVQFSARTDTGRVRAANEDNYLVDRKLKLYVVCDGLGGHRGGEVASAMAVNVVRESVVAHRHVVEAHGEPSPVVMAQPLPLAAGARATIEAMLREAITVANQRIRERAESSPTLYGMGTTLSLLLVVGAEAFIAHVGDSRIYRLREGALVQLTHDHSLANELGPSESTTLAAVHNHITRAVGVHPEVVVDISAVPILPGDRFLLTSDGLHGYVPDAEIAHHLAVEDVAEAANQLVDRANQVGGKDNVTVIVVQVDLPPHEADEPVRRWPLFEAVRNSALVFATLEDDELALVLQGAQLLALMPQDVLVQEGRPVEGLYLVAEGEAQVLRGTELVTMLRAGDFFGEDALLGERASFGSIAGSGDVASSIVLVDRAQFEDLARNHPTVALKLSIAIGRVLARKVHGAVRETAHPRFIFKDPGAMSRPVPRPAARPRTSPRVLADTEPQGVQTTSQAPPEIPASTVLHRPRSTTTRRLQPLPTQPEMPALPEPHASLPLTLRPSTRPEER